MTHDLLALTLTALIPLFLLALGQAVVMIGGGLDLSMPAVIAASAAAGGWAMTTFSQSLAAGIAVALVTGSLIGVLNGLAVVRLPLPPHIATLASLGVLGAVTSGPGAPKQSVSLSTGAVFLGGSVLGWVGVALLVGIVVHIAMYSLVWGRWLRAVGSHRESARTAGVPVGGVTVIAYAISGLCAAVAAVFLCTQSLIDESPWTRPHSLLVIIGAAVIGGVGLSGGRGTPAFVFLGAVAMVVVDAVLTAAGLPPPLVTLAQIIVFITAACVGVRMSVH